MRNIKMVLFLYICYSSRSVSFGVLRAQATQQLPEWQSLHTTSRGVISSANSDAKLASERFDYVADVNMIKHDVSMPRSKCNKYNL